MDPQEPIHAVIGVDRELSLRVTVSELPPTSCCDKYDKKLHSNADRNRPRHFTARHAAYATLIKCNSEDDIII